MINRITGILLLVLAGSFAAAQSVVESGAFLATAGGDPAVVRADRELDYRLQAAVALPLLEKVEFRTETDRFEWRRQEYLSRVSFNSLREKKRLEQVQDRENDLLMAGREENFDEVLLDRYVVLADYQRVSAELLLREQLRTVYEDRMQVLQQLLSLDTDVKPAQLIRSEVDRDELVLRQLEDSAALDRLRAIIEMALSPPAGWQLDTQGDIRPLELRQVLALQPGETAKPAAILKQEAEVARLEAEHQLEKAQTNRLLDFAQIRYADRPATSYPGDIAIGIGVQLPYRGSGKVKMAEIAMEGNAAGLELAYLQERLDRNIALGERQLAALEQQYRLLQEQIETGATRYAIEQESALDRDGIFALLEIREAQLHRQLRQEEIAWEMRQVYLEILSIQGRLTARPLLNYLRSDLAPY